MPQNPKDSPRKTRAEKLAARDAGEASPSVSAENSEPPKSRWRSTQSKPKLEKVKAEAPGAVETASSSEPLEMPCDIDEEGVATRNDAKSRLFIWIAGWSAFIFGCLFFMWINQWFNGWVFFVLWVLLSLSAAALLLFRFQRREGRRLEQESWLGQLEPTPEYDPNDLGGSGQGPPDSSTTSGHIARFVVNIPFREPPTDHPQWPTRETIERHYQRNKNLPYITVGLFSAALAIGLAVYAPWYGWINLIIVGIVLALGELLLANAAHEKIVERYELILQVVDDLPKIKWPGLENQHISVRNMFRILCTLQGGTHYIRETTRASRWQLFHKIKYHVKAFVALVVLFTVGIVGRSLLDIAHSHEQLLWLGTGWYVYFIWGFITALLILLAAAWLKGLEWYYWIYMHTDEWLHQIRLWPVWLPWKNDINLPVPFTGINLANFESQNWKGNILGYALVRIGEEKTNESGASADGLPEQNNRQPLAFTALRYMRRAPQVARRINQDIKRNEDEMLEQQFMQAKREEAAGRLQAEQLEISKQALEIARRQLELIMDQRSTAARHRSDDMSYPTQPLPSQ